MPEEAEEILFPAKLIKWAFHNKKIKFRFDNESEFMNGILDVTTFLNCHSYVRIFYNAPNRHTVGLQEKRVSLTQDMLDEVGVCPENPNVLRATFQDSEQNDQ